MKRTTVMVFFCWLAVISASIPVVAQQGPATFYQEASWSPDGKMLSFTRMQQFPDKRLASNVYVINVDGSGMKQVTGDEKNEFYSTWMKDGERVLFGMDAVGTLGDTSGKKGSDICLVKKDGTGLKCLTKESGRNATPSVSRDGKKILFSSDRDGGKPQIYVMNADGSNQKRLSADTTIASYNPVFSPDGKKIVYYTEKGDRKDQIWVMKSDGSDQTLLTGNVGHNFFPSWSPDGKKIIFTAIREDDKRGLYTMSADGTNIARWGKSNGFWARFSPDGKRVVYVVGEFPNSGVFIANADGSNEQKLKTGQ